MIDDYENWEDSEPDDLIDSEIEEESWIWVQLNQKSTGSNLNICVCPYPETANILEYIEDLFPNWLLIATYLKNSPT